MTTSIAFDRFMERASRGDRLTADEIRDLAATPDVLSLGMIADAARRRLHDTQVTFLRVAESPFEGPCADGVPPAAREVRLTGSPGNLAAALEAVAAAKTAVAAAKTAARDCTVAAFSWTDVERWSGSQQPSRVLTSLRSAGLDAFSELPLDEMKDATAAIDALTGAGFRQLRLTIGRAPAVDRVHLLLLAGRLQDAAGCVQSINPLPMALGAFRPTTGYEDVKMVSIARLAAPAVPSIQVDWRRYGPKLAQVALTFGADDIDGVSASDEAVEGRRRAPLEEIRRNIAAAGLRPAERDGRFVVLA